jgi:hypothetical protein
MCFIKVIMCSTTNPSYAHMYKNPNINNHILHFTTKKAQKPKH